LLSKVDHGRPRLRPLPRIPWNRTSRAAARRRPARPPWFQAARTAARSTWLEYSDTGPGRTRRSSQRELPRREVP
jgi:hypothetical protein